MRDRSGAVRGDVALLATFEATTFFAALFAFGRVDGGVSVRSMIEGHNGRVMLSLSGAVILTMHVGILWFRYLAQVIQIVVVFRDHVRVFVQRIGDRNADHATLKIFRKRILQLHDQTSLIQFRVGSEASKFRKVVSEISLSLFQSR